MEVNHREEDGPDHDEDNAEHIEMFVSMYKADGSFHQGVQMCSCTLASAHVAGTPKGSFATVIELPLSVH